MAKLVLSPSQQEANQFAGGGTGYTDSEEFWMRKVADRAKARWDAQGTDIPCVVVNKGSWSANVAESNRIGATEHIALHSNAGGGHGTEVIHFPGSANGEKLAKDVYPFVASASNLPDRGIKSSKTLGEVRDTKAPAIIVEFAFHDNAPEAAEIRASVNEFADAIVKGACRHFGKTYKPATTSPTPTKPTPAPTPASWKVASQSATTINLVKG